ncbi:MAG: hypothetical protein II937_13760 [Bacteroidales bacterium]|nr:hypothetical protein [Bacteroidales bacterium]
MTDKYDYTNPDQIDNFRNASRISEDRENHLDLPYGIIEEIKERRRTNMTLAMAATKETPERYVFDIKDYIGWNIYYLIKYAVERIELGSAEIPSLNTLVLTEGNVDMNDDTNFAQTNIDALNTLVAELYGEQSTALVVPTSQILAANNISTELMTAKDIERHSQYLAHKSVAIAHDSKKYGFAPKNNNDDWSIYKQKEMDILQNYARQFNELAGMFRDKYPSLLRILFCAEYVHLEDIDHPMYEHGFAHKPSPRADDIFVSNNPSFGASVFGDICLSKDCCRKVTKDKYYRTMHFKRYTELTTILGVSRDELPSYFRDYLADNYIPYYGNNILDNVKPEFVAIAKDYMSLRFPNSFDITFPFCGMCRKSMFRQYKIAEHATIKISSKKCEILDIRRN